MSNTIKISQLSSSATVNDTDLFITAVSNSGSYVTRKMSVGQLAQHITSTLSIPILENLDADNIITGTLNGTASYATNAGNASTVTNGVYTNTANTLINTNIIDVSSSIVALRITQRGTGESIRVEDESNPDSTPFIIDALGNVGIGLSNPTEKLHVSGNVEITGSLVATTKSFDIVHPTNPAMRLRYGSLEGPENGVYVRGKTNSNIIELPDYWTGLVDENTISVNITPLGSQQHLWVEKIENNKVYIGGEIVQYYFTITGERKDVSKLIVEY